MDKEINNKPTNQDIKKWSEGNEHLEKLLLACKLNNIPSIFCCAGHNKNNPAYIMLKVNKEITGKIYSIINSLRDKDNISISFSRIPIFSDVRFSVHMNDENEKNSIMDSMAEAAYIEERLENLPDNFQSLLKVAELLINDKLNFDLTYYKEKERKIYFKNLILKDANYPFDKKIRKMGFTLIKNGANNHYFINGITEKKEYNVWKNIFNGIKNICEDIREDSNIKYGERKKFEELISKNGEYKKLYKAAHTISSDKNTEEKMEKNI